MSKSSSQTSKNETTRTLTPYSGQAATDFQQGYNKYMSTMGSKTGAQIAQEAQSNPAYTTGMNTVQDNALTRAQAVQGNANLLSYANGDKLDVTKDPVLQAQIARGLQGLQGKWAEGIDSVNASMGRGGVGASSMRINSQDKLASGMQSSMTDYTTQQQAAAKQQAFQEMMGANTLLNNAGNTGFQYQQAAQGQKDSAIANAAKAYGIDANTWEGWMKLMQLARNPTENTNQVASSEGSESDPWGTASSFAGGIAALCFVAGTLVQKPGGEVPIETIKVGDVVETVYGPKKVSKAMVGMSPTVTITTTKSSVTTTPSEWMVTLYGSCEVSMMKIGDVLVRNNGLDIIVSIEHRPAQEVYEIVVPWFYANGFVVDGFDPESCEEGIENE